MYLHTPNPAVLYHRGRYVYMLYIAQLCGGTTQPLVQGVQWLIMKSSMMIRATHLLNNTQMVDDESDT